MTLKGKKRAVEPEVDDTKLEKYVLELRGAAKRTKQILNDVLEKSKKRFNEDLKKPEFEDKKNLLLKKLEKVTKDLEVLNDLSEIEIIVFAVTERRNLMALATNKRMPLELRMKARLACHKPLSTYLHRVKERESKAQESKSEEDEDEKESKKSTLDKVTFNNYIIMMRKDVKRAKVHIIHKLSRNIKKLKSAKGSEEKLAKCQRKAERLKKKIIHIKELLEDDVSKLALSTTQDLSKLAVDVNAPMSSQAMATIAINKFVSCHISDFKTRFPDWQKTVPILLKKKKKKRKLNLDTTEKSEKSKGVSETGTNIDDKSSSDESGEEEEDEDNDENSGDESEGEDDNKQDSDDSEEIENSGDDGQIDGSGDSDHLVNQGEESSDDEESDNKISGSEEDIEKNTVHSFSKTKTKVHSKIPSKTKNNKMSSDVKVSKIKNKKPNEKLNSVKKIVKDEPKVVDPFFVTASNEEYKTSQVPKFVDEIPSNRNKKDNFDSMRSNNDFDKWGIRDKNKGIKRFNKFDDSAPFKKQFRGRFEKPQTINNRMGNDQQFANRKMRRKALHQPPVEEKAEKLHPSWEAKKKQSTIIPFQGRKVKFD